MSLKIETQTKDDAKHRYGQDFTLKNAKFAMQRNPYIFRWTFGIINTAMGKGIKIVTKGTDVQEDWMIEASDIINANMKTIMNAFAYDRGQGKSLLLLYKAGKKIYFKFYPRNDYRVTYEAITGKITKISVTDRVSGEESKAEDRTLTEQELKYAIEIISWPSEVVGDGIPAITPIWDTSYSLYTTDANLTKFIIRVGGGLFVAYIPESKMNDSAYMAGVDETMQLMDSVEQRIKIPKSDTSDQESAEIKQLDSNQPMNGESAQLQFLHTLSAATGYPTEAWKGSETSLRSSEVNQGETFSIHQDIRENYNPRFEELINMLNTEYNWYGFNEELEFDDNYNQNWEVTYNKRYVMTEEEEFELLLQKIEFTSMALSYMDEKDVSDITGFEVTKPEPIDMTPDEEEEEETDEEIEEDEQYEEDN